MNTNLPLVSLITVNYNGLSDTVELIESLLTHIHSVTWEIIVVDNGSQRNEAAELSMLFANRTNCLFVRSEYNLGFAGGNNLGIAKARGELLFFINNDTFVINDGFKALSDRILLHRNIGGVSPKILFNETNFPIQFAGYTPLSTYTMRNKLIGFGQRDDGSYNFATQSPYMHGAAMMLSKKVIEQVGVMPDLFFLYYEELDWSERVRKAGYEIWYEPNCQIIHKESQSTGKESPLRTYYLTRNRLLFAKRNLSPTHRILTYLYQVSIALPKNCFIYLIQGKVNLSKAYLKGVIDFFNHKYGQQWH